VIGVVGNGQLGRMFADAAHDLGYRVWVFGPGTNSPAGQRADREFDAGYDDEAALTEFATGTSVVTFEFENIPRPTLDFLAKLVPVYPSPEVLHTTQHRLREKDWLHSNGFPLAKFVSVRSRAELEDALDYVGIPAVLKTAAFGYDGKGQQRIEAGTDLDAAWNALGSDHAILEAWVDFTHELSVVVARNLRGETRCFPVCHNEHHRHILAITKVPAQVPGDIIHRAEAYAAQVAQALKVVGLITAEMFLTREGEILINELAPRPHNSGHFSLNACSSSQFHHHVLAITHRPLPKIELRQPALMANILGDLWENSGGTPDWDGLRALPGAHLHLYGKAEAKARRKMGHLTVLGQCSPDLEQCLVRLGRDQLFTPPAPPSAPDLLRAHLSAQPFSLFSVQLKDGRLLRVDGPDALARVRDRWVHANSIHVLTSFTDSDIASVTP
jgi:5-(carboxyamino)imidazole ribonucleotide synthase